MVRREAALFECEFWRLRSVGGQGEVGSLRRRQSDSPQLRVEAFALGAFWLAVAVAVDYVGFVLIKNPISLTPHDFYIGQFPWIYLIYVAIFLAPLCWVKLAKV